MDCVGVSPVEQSKGRDEMDERFARIRADLEAHIRELCNQAKDTAARFLDYTIKVNKGREWRDQITLFYRVRQEEGSNTLTLEWYQRVWKTDQTGDRINRHKYIRKRNKNKRGTDLVYGYDLDDLFKFAPEWSRERVVEAESEAKSLRRQAHYCASMLIILGRLERFLAESEDCSVKEAEA
jgi:hypothetical protein